MNINLTLLIQVINFWLAYALLKKIILEPGYALVERLETERAAAINALQIAHANIAGLAAQKQEEWRQFQQQYHITLPAQEMMPSIKIPLLESVPLDQQEEQTIVKKVCARLIAKVLG